MAVKLTIARHVFYDKEINKVLLSLRAVIAAKITIARRVFHDKEINKVLPSLRAVIANLVFQGEANQKI